MKSLQIGSAVACVLGVVAVIAWPQEAVESPEMGAGPFSDGSAPDEQTVDAPITRRVEAPAKGTGWYWAPRGSAFVFDVKSRFKAQWLAKQERSTALDVGMDARVSVVVIARREAELVARYQIDELEFRSGSTEQRSRAALRDLEHDLRQPVFVRMSNDGNTLGYRFSDKLRGDTENWSRSIVSAMRCVLAAGDAKQWSTRESDSSGPALYAYKQTRDETPLLYVARKRESYDIDHEAAPEGSGSGSYAFDRSIGWLRVCDWQERSRLIVPQMQARLDYELKLCAMLVSHKRVAISNSEGIDWAEAWEPLSLTFGGSEVSKSCRREERDRWAQRLEGTTVDELIALLLRDVNKDSIQTKRIHDLQTALSWLLRLRPSALAALRRAVIANSRNEPLVAVLTGALGQAGTPETQAALVALADNGSLPESLRTGALASLAQVESTGTAARDIAWQIARSPSSSPDMANTGLLVYGVLAGKPGDGAQGAMQRLIDLEPEATRTGKLKEWVSALANSSSKEARPILLRYAGHQDERLRLRALRGLTEYHGKDVSKVFERSIAGEANAELRAEAVLGLSRQNVGVDPFRKPLADPHAVVRTKALDAIAKRLQRPSFAKEARTLLEHASKHDPDPRLREYAGQLLKDR